MNAHESWLTEQDGLVDRLRAIRTEAGLSAKELAEAAGWHPSKVSKIDTGKQVPTVRDLEVWARVCHADAETRGELLDRVAALQATHRDWKRRMSRGQAGVQMSYNELIQATRLIRHFETVWVPGLLQTSGYARRVLTEMVTLHGLAVEDVDAAVAARMQRQQLLYDNSKLFEFLLAEPVLRWQICPPAMMRAQLDRLQTVIDLPNIRFGVLPLGVRLATTPQNSFQMYDDLAVAETFIGESNHRGEEAAAYARVMDLLWQEAATGDEARRLVVRAAEDVPRGDEAEQEQEQEAAQARERRRVKQLFPISPGLPGS